MLESLGPLHKVRLESGSTVEARARTVVEYDKGAPTPKEGEAWPHLPTTETISALTPSGEKLEPRVTETKYNWELRKPKDIIVDPEGLKLRTHYGYTGYGSGQVTEWVRPRAFAGGGYESNNTVTYYYRADEAGIMQCRSKRLAGLPCMVFQAYYQPETVGLPETLVTRYLDYNALIEPTEMVESPGGKEAGKDSQNEQDLRRSGSSDEQQTGRRRYGVAADGDRLQLANRDAGRTEIHLRRLAARLDNQAIVMAYD